jgi:ssDNA-binding Zn-finger/Zn-ribbon topoisomerase 1
LLEGSGLEVSLFDENLSNIDPPAAIIIGGIKVAVPKCERELAREVLEEYRGEAGQHAAIGRFSPFSLEDVDVLGSETREDEEYRCPQCRVLLEAETTVCPKCGAVPFGSETGPAKHESRF